MLCPQSRSAVAIGPIAASDTDTALLLRRLRPYLLPVARLPRAPALVPLRHAAACLVGGVAGAVAPPLRRLARLGAPDSAALAGLAGGAACGLLLPPEPSPWRTRPSRLAFRIQANLFALSVAGHPHALAEPG